MNGTDTDDQKETLGSPVESPRELENMTVVDEVRMTVQFCKILFLVIVINILWTFLPMQDVELLSSNDEEEKQDDTTAEDDGNARF